MQPLRRIQPLDKVRVAGLNGRGNVIRLTHSESNPVAKIQKPNGEIECYKKRLKVDALKGIGNWIDWWQPVI